MGPGTPTVRLPKVPVPPMPQLGPPPDGAEIAEEWPGRAPGPLTPPPVPREFDLVRRRMGTGLVPGEKVLVAQHRHPVVLLEPVLSSVAVLILVGGLSPYLGSLDLLRGVLLVGWLLLVVRAAWRFAEWGRDWFVVTDRRLLRLHGIIDTKRDMMPLQKVTDMAFERPFWGRLVGFGTFTLESAGREQALREIRYVREPERTYETICVQIFTRPARFYGPGSGYGPGGYGQPGYGAGGGYGSGGYGGYGPGAPEPQPTGPAERRDDAEEVPRRGRGAAADPADGYR
jgi:hypothetical protein